MSQLLQELLIISQLSESTGVDATPLTKAKEYQDLEKVDPAFTKKLLIAWDLDGQEYVNTKGTNKEHLFLLNFNKYQLETKFPKISKLHNLQQLENGLIKLYLSTFPPVSGSIKVDNSVWQHEKWAKEALFTKAEHDMLREELTNDTNG